MKAYKSDAWRVHWDKKRAKTAEIVESGVTLIQFTPTVRDGRLHVSAPYSQEFVVGAKELTGKWRRRTKVWSFPGPCKRLVIELCTRIYGKETIRLKGFGPNYE